MKFVISRITKVKKIESIPTEQIQAYIERTLLPYNLSNLQIEKCRDEILFKYENFLTENKNSISTGLILNIVEVFDSTCIIKVEITLLCDEDEKEEETSLDLTVDI